MGLRVKVGAFDKTKVLTVISVVAFLISAFVGSYLRLYPVINSESLGYEPLLNELDPYSEYWVAEKMLEKGLTYYFSLTRDNNETHIFWYPWGRDFVKSSLPMLPFFSVLTYQIAKLFNQGLTLFEWMVYLPILFYLMSLTGIYLSARELWGDIPAATSAVITALIFNSRQIAGFTVKYSVGLAFFFIAIYFYVRTLKHGRYLDALLTGVFLAATAAGWAGFNLLLAAMFLHTVLLPLIKEKITYKDVILWALETLPLALTISVTPFYGVLYLIKSVGVIIPLGFATLAIALGVLKLASSRTVRLKYPLLTKYKVIYLLLIALIGVGGLLGLVSGAISVKGKGLAAMGLKELTHVLVGTVQEYAPGDAQTFITSAGAPLIVSLLMLIYFAYRALLKKDQLNLFVGILLLVIFYATVNLSYFYPLLNYTVALTQAGFVALLLNPLIKRGVRRDWFTTLLALVLLISYVGVTLAQGALLWVNAYRSQTPLILDSGLGVGVEAPAWLDTLNWLRTNTPKDSVVVSWWDYGYWISVVGERASVADGATLNTTQIELLAKALTSDEREAYKIFTQDFRIPPEKLYVVVYDVVLVSDYYLAVFPGPLAFQNAYLGADAAKGISAIYRIANKTPPTAVAQVSQYVAYSVPDWTSNELRNATLYKILLDSIYEVFGREGYTVRFLYTSGGYWPEIPRPKMEVFKPAYIAVSKMFQNPPVYVIVAVYKVGDLSNA
ncbi:MAG: hypothetical protein B7O98_07185 [Zestosphaera tikiterensis]|uniref:dolichyl-phosphooligosaccharide-protein glycotransferase n=1 Tax=Zestosphaera tikiterensis TaxID=1973259 RepID=A0A2R7Y4I4_9CREN|nr:MAG: hypothetical protein B7O98_07185 [Zestosphaera tikiterensis]